MKPLILVYVVFLCGGCALQEPGPPVGPLLEDLSQWTVPELVQPERQKPKPVALPPSKVPAGPAEKVVEYQPGITVEVLVPMGMPLDIVLEPGEQVRAYADGDRAPVAEGQAAQHRRWEVKEAQEGTGPLLRPHLFVTASEPGLTNGLTITTTKRVYYLTLKSVARGTVRVVRWHYPHEAGKHEVLEAEEKPPGLLPDPQEPKRYHSGYSILAQGRRPDWTPRWAVDDGKKMFLVLPEVTLFATAPMVRMIGPNGPALVNARTYLNVIIIDQLAAKLELRVGLGDQAEVVQVTRGQLTTIECPGAPECPIWPAAAQALARRAQP